MSRTQFRVKHQHQTKVEPVQRKESIVGISGMILLLKAVGGHRFRELIDYSDKEVQDFAKVAENNIKLMGLRLVVAERILKSKAPSYEPRWSEYVEKVKEVQEKEKKL